jgi:NADH-quinone oxidoreductase subunit L
MVINRIGDIFFLIGICLLIMYLGSIKYKVVFGLIIYLINIKILFLFNEFSLLDIVCFFLFVGAMGKSAQLGLHI